MTANLETAQTLARAGIFILPCDPTTKAPRLPGWTTRATNKPNGVRYYWERYGYDSMPGIAMGLSGLVAVDIDVKNGIDGHAAMDLLLERYGELPFSSATRTPSGGTHCFFRQPTARAPIGNATGALPRGIDIRGFGGQAIAPGAITSNGTFYECVPGWPDLSEAFAGGTIPEIPGWIVDLIEQPKRPASVEGCPSAGGLPSGRASDDKSAWAAEGLSQETHLLATAAEGGRNNALYKFVCTFAGHAANGWTTQAEVHAAAKRACVLNGYLASEWANDGPKQFEKTFSSGWRWGYAHPTIGPRERLTADPAFAARIKLSLKN